MTNFLYMLQLVLVAVLFSRVSAESCPQRVLVFMSGVSLTSPSSYSIARQNAAILNATVCYNYARDATTTADTRIEIDGAEGLGRVSSLKVKAFDAPGHSVRLGRRSPLHCIISVIDLELPVNVSDWKTMLGCDISLYTDGEYADNLKTMLPPLIRAGNFSHVFVLAEGMALNTSFDLSRFLDIMSRNGLSVASPSISSAQAMPVLKPHSSRSPVYNIGFYSTVFELRAAVFTAAAWNTFHELLSPYFNLQPHIYGTYFFHYARHRDPSFKMGVIRSMAAAHPSKRKFRRLDKRNIEAIAAFAQEKNPIDADHGLKSPIVDERTFAYLSYHDLVFFNVLNSSDCSSISPSCTQNLFQVYKSKHDYGQDWVDWMREEAGEVMRRGVATSPDDGAMPEHFSSDGWIVRKELALQG